MAERHFRETGNAAEVGVHRGGFSKHALTQWSGRYWMIDSWAPRSDGSDDKNDPDPRWHRTNYQIARRAVRPHMHRVELVPSLSVDAARNFSDGFFDWVYIDALHTKQAMLQDLEAWWPKLRAGGLCSGDDYGDRAETEYINATRAKQALRSVSPSGAFWDVPKRYDWGVIRAVSTFARRVGAVLHVSWLHGSGLEDDATPTCYTWPAWYMVKPYAKLSTRFNPV